MTFEQKLFGGRDSKEKVTAFANCCRAIFGTPEGKHVLAALCGAAHPLKHSAGMSDHDHGQSEVVATLWRFGSNEAAIPNT